jgi:hypothetical protein
MDEGRTIDAAPSVAADVRVGDKTGKVFLSAIYGSYNFEITVPCKDGEVGEFSCPHCRKALAGLRTCELCRAPMAAFALREGGLIQICSRRGCRKHLIEFEDPGLAMKAFYDKFAAF